MRFSANLGFLFTDLTLPQAIHAAAQHGFAAVECHFPYDAPPADVQAALRDTGLPMLGLNTERGDLSLGEFGLAAVPGRKAAAHAAIAQAVDYATRIGARNVHVMAGKTDGGTRAEDTYRAALDHACTLAAGQGIGILIEPINHRDVPGYHLNTVEHGADIVAGLGHANLAVMFDCYHTQIMQGDLIRRLERHLPYIGHVQIAAVPDRGEPDEGEVAYAQVLRALAGMGYDAPVGAEYKPRGKDTTSGLGWMAAYRNDAEGETT